MQRELLTEGACCRSTNGRVKGTMVRDSTWSSQSLVSCTLSLALQFFSPEHAVTCRHRPMAWAGVPETPVYKNGHTLPAEDEVRPSMTAGCPSVTLSNSQ